MAACWGSNTPWLFDRYHLLCAEAVLLLRVDG